MTHRRKQLNLLIIVALITAVIIFVFPYGNKLLLVVRNHPVSAENSVLLPYTLPENFITEDTTALPPAQAVPILMYHGVRVDGELGANTERNVFISQLEMLKQKGFTTISVYEYELFREGKFVLPAKPIIITFDDGRKDSFYTVDNVLEKLNFKATIFIATVNTNNNEPFFLSWDELAKVKDTGRWEIEAHGRRSHETVIIDSGGKTGTYLASRIYYPNQGLESIEDFKKRVEQDYIDGIADLKTNLGVDAAFLAVPLNSYGTYDLSNYKDAYNLNLELTRRYFKLSFVQAQQDENNFFESFYNYRDTEPYINLKRLEVKNISADELDQLLERFSPKSPALEFQNMDEVKAILQNTNLLYGALETNRGLTLLSGTTTPSARILLGDKRWENYSLRARVAREKGRSVSIIAYYTDEDNFIYLSWGEKSLSLNERINGKENKIASYYPWEKTGPVEILVRVRDNYISAYFSGIVLAQGLPINLTRGAAGFSVWDPSKAQSTLTKLEIKSLVP